MPTDKIQINPNKKYVWWKDKKMVGTFFLIGIVAMQIFAFLEVPFLSTIHSYTIGLLFGYHNPLFYIFFAYLALLMIFQEKVTLPKWMKLSKKSYWFLTISIIFVSTSSGYYQSKLGWTIMGSKPWQSFNVWFNKFTNNQQVSFWAPHWTNGGLIGAFCFAFSAMLTSGIGAIIISILLICISMYVFIIRTLLGFYKEIIVKQKLILHDNKMKRNKIKENKMKEDKDLNLNQFPKPIYNKEKIEKISDKKPKEDLPFEDPFEVD